MNLTSTVSLAGLLATVLVLINWIRYLTNLKTHLTEFLTQILVWAVGIVVLLIASHAAITSTLVIYGAQLHTFDAWSIILGGIILGSFASGGYQILGAIDNTRSTAVPPLIPPPMAD